MHITQLCGDCGSQDRLEQSHLFHQIESLKVDLGKKDAALTAAETKLEALKGHQSNQQEHIGVLQTSLSAKEHHIKNLQGEVRVTQ